MVTVVRNFDEREVVTTLSRKADFKYFLEERAKALWEVCKADFKRLGYFPKADVTSLAEARERVRNYFAIA